MKKIILSSIATTLFLGSSLALAQDTPREEFKQFTLTGDDAKAIYNRLQKKEYIRDGKDEVHTKVGQNVLCTLTSIGGWSKNKEWQCVFSIRVPRGELHEQYPIGEEDANEGLKSKPEYMGQAVEIKKDQDEAQVFIRGPLAQEIYEGISKTEEKGLIQNGKIVPGDTNEPKNGNQDGTSILMKKTIHLQCYKTLFTISPIWECTIRINPVNGKALPLE